MDQQNAKQLISEKDGSDIAGVSPETLRQYRSIGILQGIERDGEIFYSRDELAAVFFIRPQYSAQGSGSAHTDAAQTTSAQPSGAQITAETPAKTAVPAEGQDGGLDSTTEKAMTQPSVPAAEPLVTSPVIIGVISAQTQTNGFSAQHEAVSAHQTVFQDQTAEATAAPGAEDIQSQFSTPEYSAKARPLAESSVTPSGDSKIDNSYEDRRNDERAQTAGASQYWPVQTVASRLPSAIDPETSQLTRTLRDQIEMLREERDWLRTRLEKLELRYEREQMILLSENDTVRTLISQIGKPKRRWWHALPWFKQEDQKR